MIKGITRRWIFNTLGVLVLVLFVIVIGSDYLIQNYYYNGIYQTICGRSNELASLFANNKVNDAQDFNTAARNYIENFSDKAHMELMVFDAQGQIFLTSTGFAADTNQPTPDYNQAKESKNGFGSWQGKLSSGEKVLAVTRVIYDSKGSNIGAVRYVVSLEAANRYVFLYVAIILLAALLLFFFVVVSGTYFIRSIVTPVREMSVTAKRIAQGDFEAKLKKRYDDEIGDLCDSINYMADELGAADKMKNDFISSVSHELRTPLTAIKGWAETMNMEGAAPDKATLNKGLNVIIKETARLTGIVEELLDFSRIQGGRMVLMMDRIDVLAELDEAIYMLRERVISENKHLLYDEPEQAPAILGDKNRLRQVFLNVIDNAIKFTEEDGVIGIQVVCDEENIHIIISDNGCGIPEEHMARIKDKFYKANQSSRGSGIGLAVADEIVALHKGKLDIDSQEGVGTKVTITLPLLLDYAEDAIQ